MILSLNDEILGADPLHRIHFSGFAVCCPAFHNDGVKLLPGEQPVHLVERTKVGLDERQILPVVPGQFDHALHGELERVVQVIDDRQLIAWIASGVG